MESGIYMRDESSTEDTKPAGLSPLRLRVGVFLILLWILPFWLLAEPIAHSLSGLSNPPSVVAVTTAIVVLQTILGLLGFWVAGTEVKSIIKGLHDEACPRGHLVDIHSRGYPRSGRRRR